MNFCAIDFETATQFRNSACAVGIVTVQEGLVTDTFYTLIRPPQNQYSWRNTEVHGLEGRHTANEKPFAEIYPEIQKRLQCRTIVAHNESFDRSVLTHCMESAGLDYLSLNIGARWECTLKIYREKGFNPCRLSDCCNTLNIALDHHDAKSDAQGCAELYLRR